MVRYNVPALGLLASLISCYGVLATIAILSFAGITVRINDWAWAAVIVGFAALALVGLGATGNSIGGTDQLALAPPVSF